MENLNFSSKRPLDDTELSDDDVSQLFAGCPLNINEETQMFMENPMELDEDMQFLLEVSPELGEVSQCFIENPMPLPLYYHIGSGFEMSAQPAGSGAPFIMADEISRVEDAVILVEQARRPNKKFKTQYIIYRARIDPEKLPRDLRDVPIAAIVDSVRALFQLLIDRTTEGLSPTDLIRFCIQAAGLDKPISTTMMKVSEMTVEKIIAPVMKVLQSKEEIQLDEGFHVDVITVPMPVGAGRVKLGNIAFDRMKKHSILAIPYDDEGLCCAKAIVYALAHLDNDQTAIKTLRDKRRPALMNRARALHQAAGVPLGPCSYQEVALFEEHINVQIVVYGSDNLNKVTYKGNQRPRRINLWQHDGHFDVIKSMNGFYGSHFYCEACEKSYARINEHRCTDACHVCLRPNCVPGETERCQDCDRLCRSADCFSAHKTRSGKQELSLCDRVYQCRICCKVIRRRDCPQHLHRCGTSKCPSCKQHVVPTEHLCYLPRVSPKDPSEKLIFFDFETDQYSGTHEVNFAVAQYQDGREVVFSGYSACADFCTWLFTPRHKGYTAIAHNMKGFDGQFIMAWLLQQGTAPEVIPNGSMLMSIRALSVRIIDSLNFLPMPLAKLPSCFDLAELKKGYFPHLFNTRENQSYVGPIPEADYFSPKTMSTAAYKTFTAWYQEQTNVVFDFQKEMLDYCRSDVDILRRSCLQFREQFILSAGVDPFQYVTIAAACMATYRGHHIQANTIGMVPTHGYLNKTLFSPDCIRWLDFIAQQEKINIQHALNGAGEQKIGGFSVDGLCLDTRTIYQFQGCFFHGCETCYDPDLIHPLKNVTMGSLREKTQTTTEKLKALDYTVVEIWEHVFRRQKQENPELQSFLETHSLQDRLNPRDAFFGGRTNAVKLYHEGTSKYVDFTSLYPWVNKYCFYPVGHPQILTENFGEIEDYFGLIQCKVVPPRGLYLPVLPYRTKDKLMFPLCKTCTENLQQSPCTHTEDERALVGTWVSEELKLAKKKGYRITQIFEVYHFQETSDSMFRSYIDLFLKIKQESSGWPSDCVSEEDKLQYIQQYKEREGVQLEYQHIQKNPGRRQVAKLALCSFWGQWGMNTNKTQLKYVNTVADFNKTLADSTKNIKDIYLPTPEVAAIQWESTKDFVEQDASTNIFLAAFTTAWARLKLYEEMDKLGRNVLYHDTDSIIYASDGTNDPPLGNFLGEFTDELNGDSIQTFVSGGPKNYAYKTVSEKTCCKVRGFTLNFRNSQVLNYDSLKHLVCELSTDTIPITNPAKITREPKRRKIVNKKEIKAYRLVYNKRVIQPDFTTLPYGY